MPGTSEGDLNGSREYKWYSICKVTLRYCNKSSQLGFWPLHSPREIKYGVHSEVLSKVTEKGAAAQTELTKNHEKHAKLHTVIQTSSYRECPGLL